MMETINSLYALAPPVVRTKAFGQLLRFVLAGFAVTLFSSLVYIFAAYELAVRPLLANVISYLFGVIVSYSVHSRWSFASEREGGELDMILRFLLGSGIAFAMNSFWVWLATGLFQLAAWVPVPAMIFVTPLASFLINRYWVFRAA